LLNAVNCPVGVSKDLLTFFNSIRFIVSLHRFSATLLLIFNNRVA
jgi:hypothetical protein